MAPEPQAESNPQSKGQVPDAAVGSAAEALCENLPDGLELHGGTWIEDPLADEWGDWAFPALQAALPAIHAARDQEWQQRLEEVERRRDELQKCADDLFDQFMGQQQRAIDAEAALARREEEVREARERLEREADNFENVRFLAEQESLTLGAEGNHLGEHEAKGIVGVARNARDTLQHIVVALSPSQQDPEVPREEPDFDKALDWIQGAVTVGYPNEHAALVDYCFAPPESYDDAWLLR